MPPGLRSCPPRLLCAASAGCSGVADPPTPHPNPPVLPQRFLKSGYNGHRSRASRQERWRGGGVEQGGKSVDEPLTQGSALALVLGGLWRWDSRLQNLYAPPLSCQPDSVMDATNLALNVVSARPLTTPALAPSPQPSMADCTAKGTSNVECRDRAGRKARVVAAAAAARKRPQGTVQYRACQPCAERCCLTQDWGQRRHHIPMAAALGVAWCSPGTG